MIRLTILAFALGAALLQTRPELPDLALAWLLPLGGFLAWRLPGRGRQAALLVLGMAIGFLYAAGRAEIRLAETLPQVWEGRDQVVTGRVQDLPETTPRGLRFTLHVVRVATPGSVPQRIQVGWVGRPGESPPSLRGGDCVQVVARLYQPHGQVNPGGFDYEGWLLERGIRAVGHLTAKPVTADCTGESLASRGRAALDRARDGIRSRLRDALGDRPYAGVVRALAVGEQDAIPSAQWTLFRQTGVTHLMSISGLHITLFSALVYALAQTLWRRIPGLALHLPARKAGALLGFAAAAAYTALAGFGIPAQRTLFMLAGAAVMALLDRTGSSSRLLAAALLVVVLVDPWAAFAPGFWLSFGAVAALLWAGSGRLRPPPKWRVWVEAQWAVTLVLTPALLLLFHEVSLVSPLANAVAIPLISLLAVPASLLAVLLPWDALALLAHAIVSLTLLWLESLARLPQPVFHAAAPGLPALLLALLGAAVLLMPRGVPRRWLALFLFLPLFFPRLPAPAPGALWVTALDVGQGEAVLLRTARHTLLYDSGPRHGSGEDAGARVIAPTLWRIGENHLDGLVVSHDDLDHSGGTLSLLASHRPGWVLTSIAGVPITSLGEIGTSLRAARPDALSCRAGQHWEWDGVKFQVLHPPAHHYAQPGYPDNARSCVVRVDAAGGSVLLTGDIERLAEMNLLERRQLLAADVLVVPHHGSDSSSSPAFLAAVQPRHIVIPVGHRNRFGHPHPTVLARYRALNVPIWRTDRHGAVDLRLQPEGIAVTTARQTEARYWRK